MKLLRGLPYNHFQLIGADVPWKYVGRGKNGDRSVENHYGTMTLADIQRLDVVAHAAENCLLAFWVTGPFLAIGAHIPIMRAWGFEPTAMGLVWIKTSPKFHQRGTMSLVSLNDPSITFMGLGHTTRQNAEYVVFGKRGHPQRLSKAVRQVILAPPREHSRKPEEFYQRMEAYCSGPRLDLFGRQQRDGWTVRGNEANKFRKISRSGGIGLPHPHP